jgi:hypothetical protein
MDSVFLVQHLHALTDGDNIKIIGIYRTRNSALQAVDRLKHQPGFGSESRVVDPDANAGESGFYVEEYRLEQDHWPEGYLTVDA